MAKKKTIWGGKPKMTKTFGFENLKILQNVEMSAILEKIFQVGFCLTFYASVNGQFFSNKVLRGVKTHQMYSFVFIVGVAILHMITWEKASQQKMIIYDDYKAGN